MAVGRRLFLGAFTAGAVTVAHAATSGSRAALNVASKNPQTSALNVTGVENAQAR